MFFHHMLFLLFTWYQIAYYYTEGEIKVCNLIRMNLQRTPVWEILAVDKGYKGDSDMIFAPEEFDNESLSI